MNIINAHALSRLLYYATVHKPMVDPNCARYNNNPIVRWLTTGAIYLMVDCLDSSNRDEKTEFRSSHDALLATDIVGWGDKHLGPRYVQNKYLLYNTNSQTSRFIFYNVQAAVF